MALILPNSIYLHPPKTGGNWVKTAIAHCSIPMREEGGDRHAIHLVPNKYVFTFVRHPASWYISRFRCPWHRSRIHRQDVKDVDCLTKKEARNFQVWMDRVLRDYPAYVTNLYDRYTRHADFVGKQENLTEDLIEALRRAGEDVKPMIIRKTNKIHVSEINTPHYTEELLDRVLKSEAEVIKKFGYEDTSRWNFLPVKIL